MAGSHNALVIPMSEGYAVSCSCGWIGRSHASPRPAEQEAEDHEADPCRWRRDPTRRLHQPMSPRQPDELTERFARTLRRVRLMRHLSQEDLADLCDMHRTEISLMERGRREPRLEILLKFSAVLEVSIAEFSDGIEWQPSARKSSTGRFLITPERDVPTARFSPDLPANPAPRERLSRARSARPRRG